MALTTTPTLNNDTNNGPNSVSETEAFCEVIRVPELSFPGAVQCEEIDEQTVRIYPAFGE